MEGVLNEQVEHCSRKRKTSIEEVLNCGVEKRLKATDADVSDRLA